MTPIHVFHNNMQPRTQGLSSALLTGGNTLGTRLNNMQVARDFIPF